MYSRPASLVPFLIFSAFLHLALILGTWPKPVKTERVEESFPIAFIPSPEQKKEPTEKRNSPNRSKTVNTRPPEPPGQVAKYSTTSPETNSVAPTKTPKGEVAEKIKEPPPLEEPPEVPGPPRRAREQPTIVQRPLPTLKDLLPPVTWAPAEEKTGRAQEAVQLNTREPKYISYFASIKRAIELVWEYPEPALRYGLQGKLVLEFTILGNGQLERTRMIRSSGSSVLDAEAMRAVKAAAPFHAIPPWIGRDRLEIIASFEYLDNRLNYGLAP